MKGEASCMTMVGILSTGVRSKEEVTEQYMKMARWLLRLHGNCRNGILRAFSRWWRLWRCGILTCCVWLSTTFLFSLNHSQVLSSSFFIKHLKCGVLPHNSYGHILKKRSGTDNEICTQKFSSKIQRKDTSWRPGHSLYNTIKMDLKETQY